MERKRLNIKSLRTLHLYLGCFFAPLLILFIITGCWQTFGFHETSKSNLSYHPPAIVESLSEIHIHQRFTSANNRPTSSIAFRYLVLLMSLGFFVTTVLGIIMALQLAKSRVVWAILSAGIVLPVLLLWVARGFK